jgi:hypothetical protein
MRYPVEGAAMANTAAARVVYVVDADASVRQGLARLVDSAGLESVPCDSIEAFLGQTPGTRIACALLEVSGLLQCEAAICRDFARWLRRCR